MTLSRPSQTHEPADYATSEIVEVNSDYRLARIVVASDMSEGLTVSFMLYYVMLIMHKKQFVAVVLCL